MRDAAAHWQQLSPVKRAAVLAVVAWNFTLLFSAERDIQRRSAAEIRGPKGAWRLACLLNTVGPLSYFRWGRR